MKKRIPRLLSLLLSTLVLLSLLVPAASAAQAPEVQAGAALLMDAVHDELLYEKNARQKMYPASLTKVMTALLVLEAVEAGQLKPDQVVTASSTFSKGLSIYGSTQNIKAGEQMTLLDLLYCLLVASANESANILAETVCGDVDTFVARMNERAAELGCEGTHFANPHGLHDDNHYTTAYDIYLIARKAMENETFRTIVSSRRHEIPATNLSDSRLFYSTNALLVTWFYRESYLYDKAIGIKTGTTDEGGYCLLSAARDEDRYLICVVLNAPLIEKDDGSTDRRQFTESRALLQWGFANFKRQSLVDTATPLAQVAVTLSNTDHVLVRPAYQLERTLPRDMDLSAVEQTIQLASDSVAAPVEEGQVLGTLTLTHGDQTIGQVDLVAVSGAERSVLLYRLSQIKGLFRHTLVKLITALAILALAVFILIKLLKPSRRSRYGGRRFRARGNYRGRRRR